LERGVNFNATNKLGATALKLAESRDHHDVAKVLRKFGTG
jgi:hypothetical protein